MAKRQKRKIGRGVEEEGEDKEEKRQKRLGGGKATEMEMKY